MLNQTTVIKLTRCKPYSCRKLFSPFIILFLLNFSLHSQDLPKFVISNDGIAPVVLKMNNIKAEDLYRASLKWVKENLKESSPTITTVENKAIQLVGRKGNAFSMRSKGTIRAFDLEYTLQIEITDDTLRLSFTPGQIWWHPFSKKADFTFFDFFKTDGRVKDAIAETKEKLERNLNAIPAGLYSYLSKRDFTPVLKQDEFEKGYLKEGVKYSVWQYFNTKKEVELVINHTTGKLMYIIPDTSAFVVFKSGEWVSSKLDVHPIPTTGFRNFYNAVSDALFPLHNCMPGVEGKAVLTFEVDTLGLTTNPVLVKGIEAGCDSTILKGFKSTHSKWIPGRIGKKSLPAKFALRFILMRDKNNPSQEPDGFKLSAQTAKPLDDIVIINPVYDDRVFTFVEKSAEPVGGLEGFYKWVGKNLRYPANARRMGIEGKVFIKFIIEPSGEITHAEVVKGFYGECDQEALRVISMAPPWKPGTQSGVPVRQAYTLPMAFKLAEGGWRGK